MLVNLPDRVIVTNWVELFRKLENFYRLQKFFNEQNRIQHLKPGMSGRLVDKDGSLFYYSSVERNPLGSFCSCLTVEWCLDLDFFCSLS